MSSKNPLRLRLTSSHNISLSSPASASHQQHLLSLHQQELISSASRAPQGNPRSPRLGPLGSPGGVVTPLMLEEGKVGGYFDKRVC